jgi:hypothetical protein
VCFSATGSFTVAAALVPVAALTLRAVPRAARSWLPFALYPAAFALQQAIEGVVWLGIGSGDQSVIAIASRGFVLFSHFFWPAWVPFSMWWLEGGAGWRGRLIGVLALLGFALGATLAIPTVTVPGWLSVAVVNGSIEYETRLVYDGILSRDALKVLYAVAVVGSLVLSCHRAVQLFGLLILASVITAQVVFPYAFVSVWCFMAAVLSVAVLAAVRYELRRQGSPA